MKEVEIGGLVFRMEDESKISVEQKVKVLRAWARFLEDAKKHNYTFRIVKFTKALYEHLVSRCAFVAELGRGPFFEEYFVYPRRTATFFTQFDRNYDFRSLRIGTDRWCMGAVCSDVNQAMCQIAEPFLEGIYAEMDKRERERDLAALKLLAKKHGIVPQGPPSPKQLRFDFD